MSWEKAAGKKTEVDREWIGYTKEGKPYQKPRCHNDTHGCGRFFDSFDFDYEHGMCKQCVRAIEVNWGVPQTLVGCLLACMHLESRISSRIWSVTKNKEFMDAWSQTYPDRMRYLIAKLGNKPWEKSMEYWQKFSADYFRAALNKAGITEPQGKGIQPI